MIPWLACREKPGESTLGVADRNGAAFAGEEGRPGAAPAGGPAQGADPGARRGLLRRIRPDRADPAPRGGLRRHATAALPLLPLQGGAAGRSLWRRDRRAVPGRMAGAVEGPQAATGGAATYILPQLLSRRADAQM